MGKASSAKKVARVARAGSSRRSGQRRNLGFPITIGIILVLGVVVVAYSISSRSAVARPLPSSDESGGDHWHAAVGVYFCDHFAADLTDLAGDPLGIHTHGDGVIHIHPFTAGAAGTNSQIGLWFDDTGLEVTDTELAMPSGGESVKEGTNKCGDEDGIVQIAYWENAADAQAGERPTTVFTDDFSSIRFRGDRAAYTIAFMPEGAEIPAPLSIPTLDNLSDVIEAPEDTSTTVPGETTTTGPGETTTTGSGETTTTGPAETTTTAPADPPTTPTTS